MKRSIKRLLLLCVATIFFSFLICLFLAYRVMAQITYPVSYPKKALVFIEKNNEILKSKHHAIQVNFTTKDGVNISGMLILRKNAKRNLLLCHGYTRSKEYCLPFVDMFNKDNLLLIDFRGHGQSGGDLITVGYKEKNDIRAAVSFLSNHEKTKSLPTYGFGVSMGAASLITAAADGVPFCALISDSSFAIFSEQMNQLFTKRTGLPKFPFMYLAVYFFDFFANFSVLKHNPAEFIDLIDCPIFIVHSRDDTITPVKHAQLLYESAVEQKKLWIVDNAFHGKIYRDHKKEYMQRIAEFLQTVL
ncbi:alpha/beta hydrolase [bacterium]|nr:alpha/beta hydrolase [bacterium]